MPTSYHYFESGEVSNERLLIEIELLKQFQQANLLDNLDWKFYDTGALKQFLQAGITEVNDELNQRYIDNSNEFEQIDFIHKCIEKYQTSSIKDTFKKEKCSLLIIVDTIFIFVSLSFVIGLFIYEYIKHNSQHHLFQSLHRPLTAKRRHLSFTDDLSIILLTFTSGIILGCILISTRYSRKLIIFGLLALLIIVLLLIKRNYEIITFLSKYREVRWPMLYDYLHS